MSTMNISLPDTLKSQLDAQVIERGFSTSSEYVRDLMMQGAESEHAPVADKAYFDSLRERVSHRK